MNKRFLIFLLCSVIASSVIMVSVLIVNQETMNESITYTEQHKNRWIVLLKDNNDALQFFEQLYATNDRLTINYRNGELTMPEFSLNIFSHEELEILKEFFATFQLETIRLRKNTNDEQKMLELISSQMKFGKYFRKYFCVAVIAYSPNTRPDSTEEVFPNWHYRMYFET